MATHNATSLSRKTSGAKAKRLKYLEGRNDIIFLQETKLRAADSSSLNSMFRKGKVLYSNNPANTGSDERCFSAGVAMVVSNSFAKLHTVTPVIHPALTELQGHALGFQFNHARSRYMSHALNIRLATGCSETRTTQLLHLGRLQLRGLQLRGVRRGWLD